MPEAEKAIETVKPQELSLWQKFRNVRIIDRIEAFGQKHPVLTVGIGIGLVAGFPLSFSLGLPAYYAGAQTLATTLGLAVETGAMVGVLTSMLMAVTDKIGYKPKTALLDSGQAVTGDPYEVRAAQFMQRQFDRLAQRRDFSVKSELTENDKTALRAYQSLWQRSKLSQFFNKAMGAKVDIVRVMPLQEIKDINGALNPLWDKLKEVGAVAENPTPALAERFGRERTYDDEELKAKTAPEAVVVVNKKQQLVSKLA